VYGTVRTVVWEDEGGDSLSYPIPHDGSTVWIELGKSRLTFSPRKGI